jgi:hypothetical protein
MHEMFAKIVNPHYNVKEARVSSRISSRIVSSRVSSRIVSSRVSSRIVSSGIESTMHSARPCASPGNALWRRACHESYDERKPQDVYLLRVRAFSVFVLKQRMKLLTVSSVRARVKRSSAVRSGQTAHRLLFVARMCTFRMKACTEAPSRQHGSLRQSGAQRNWFQCGLSKRLGAPHERGRHEKRSSDRYASR